MHNVVSNPAAARRQRGISLADALIALLVLSVGLLVLSRLQIALRETAEDARERSVAVRLAQQEIERLRGFADITAWQAIENATTGVTADGGTRYTVERAVQTRSEPVLKAITITLRWVDRHGTPQQLRLDTQIAGVDPALAGALTLARPPFAHP